MAAAIYARYSSENQRPESIDDQVSACRKLAKLQSLTIADDHIYADQAQSDARLDRPALAALMSTARAGEFDVVLVDDLSRLARDNHLMLSIIAELHFEGIRVISVADGLDSTDEESTLAIQVRGIFNELQLRDLKKKTLRGQIGQKERGFFVGEKMFGYRSVPVGETKMDKKGRPRPDGYKMEIEPKEAAVILRIFTSYAEGMSLTQIVKTFNDENIPGSIRSAKGWSPATISRILDNEKYAGRWVWNKTERRRDPKTGRRHRFDKRVRVGHQRGRGAADRAQAAVGSGPRAAQGEASDLARRQRQARILEGAGQQTSALPHPPARRRHGLRLVRRHHRSGQWQERRLLRLPRRHQRRMRQQDARAPDARRESHRPSDPGPDRRPRAHRVRPPPRRR